jgi:hypothetical protein
MKASAAQSLFAPSCFMRRWSPQGERMGISGAIALRHFEHVAALVDSKQRSVWRTAMPCAH